MARIITVLSLLNVCLAGMAAAGVTITFQKGLTYGSGQTYFGATDTWVMLGDNTNKSLDYQLGIKADDSGQIYEALLCFDGIFGTGADLIPPGSVITSATLTVVSNKSNGTRASVHRLLINWPASCTFASLSDGIDQPNEYQTTPDDSNSSSVPNGMTVTYTVTGTVQAWSNNPTLNYGWVFRAVDLNPVGTSARPRLLRWPTGRSLK